MEDMTVHWSPYRRRNSAGAVGPAEGPVLFRPLQFYVVGEDAQETVEVRVPLVALQGGGERLDGVVFAHVMILPGLGRYRSVMVPSKASAAMPTVSDRVG